MKVNLSIHYNTTFGQQIYVCGSIPSLGNWQISNAVRLNYSHPGNWFVTLNISKSVKHIEYKYLLKDDYGNCTWEWGNKREINFSSQNSPVIFAVESWRSPSDNEKVMFSAAFNKVIMKPFSEKKMVSPNSKKLLQFKIQVPRISEGYQVCVLGNQTQLGNWRKGKPLLLHCADKFPLWTGSINAEEISFPLIYKYGIYDPVKKEVVTIEEGSDRYIEDFPFDAKQFLLIKSDESFRYPWGNWKGAGVSVPVFSLRSEQSFGVGEFNDLLDFIHWAKNTGMNMVQILPVNETIASHNWLDSYPYKSISVMALHPIYMNLKKMGALKDKKQMADFAEKQKELNAEIHVNYPEVLRVKSRYYKLLFDQEKNTFFEQKEYKTFFKTHKEWLVPYAAFVYLRDKMKSADFRLWKEFSTYNKKTIENLSTPQSKEWDDIAVHYFIQFHLYKQLGEVSAFARKNGIALKGDIPIGISPNSVEAWTEPHLFNLDAQAGAPPDDFSVKGQNWGFPTYNWKAMAKEGYSWWKKRLQNMALFFDAYRIDHILGFFRIWEIPINAVEGVLGRFRAALPLTKQEIENYGIRFDAERMTKPYIRHHLLNNIFGDYTGEVISKFLENTGSDAYKLKEIYDSQQKVNKYFLNNIEEEDLLDKDRKIRDGLFDLIANILFIQTAVDEWHPRISIHMTSSFNELDDYTKMQLDKLYHHYFYERHDHFWYQKGMEKLPAIIAASNMLVCGEDLGMVPQCVPPVMRELNILSLEIQRMSKNPQIKFAHPADAPYLSVCTTSTHDMPTIRGWWESNRKNIQNFYNNELGIAGEAPFFAEPWICRKIIEQHIHSPAMWTIFPIQDLISMDGKLRWAETHEEQINHPSNMRHRWRFRMHQTIEELQKATEFNELLKTLISESGRNADY